MSRHDPDRARPDRAYDETPVPDSARLTRAGAGAIDRDALVECGIPGHVLMEHAGRSVTERLLAEAWPTGAGTPRRRRAWIACGGGNNGGDGFVVARGLRDAGVDVVAFAVVPTCRTRGDALLARGIAARSGVEIVALASESDRAAVRALAEREPPDVWVDALLGTGFRATGTAEGRAGDLRREYAAAIELVNATASAHGASVWAVDLPSGLDADTGARATPTVVASVTATFVARKVGFDAADAAEVLGRVLVLPIGAPARVVARHVTRAGLDRGDAATSLTRG